MQSRLDSPDFSPKSSPDQHLMERAREAAISVRKEEQENIVLSRKRKLKDLYQITRQIECNKSLTHSGRYAFGSGLNELDESERRFLELNDLLRGRLYDETTLQQLFNATVTSSIVAKQPSPILSKKGIASHNSFQASVRAYEAPPAQSIVATEVRPDVQVPSTKSLDDLSPKGASVTAEFSGTENSVSTQNQASEDVATTPLTVRRGASASPKRRKSVRPSSPLRQDVATGAGIDPAMDRVLSSSSQSHKTDKSPLVVDIMGVPVIQNSRTPVVPAAGVDETVSGTVTASQSAVRPPPPPESLVKESLDRKVYPANGDPAMIEKDIHDSLAKLSKPESPEAVSVPGREHSDILLPIMQGRKRSPTSVHPRLAVVPPMLRDFPHPTHSPRLQNRQNTPSSPITSDEDEDDRDNSAAIISSATSPDACVLLPDDAPPEIQQSESLDKKDLLLRLSDPSAQLRLEDELARKDQSSPFGVITDSRNVKTKQLGDRGDVDIKKEKLVEELVENSTDLVKSSVEIAEDHTRRTLLATAPVKPTWTIGPSEATFLAPQSPSELQPRESTYHADTAVTGGLFPSMLDNEPTEGAARGLSTPKPILREDNPLPPSTNLISNLHTKAQLVPLPAPEKSKPGDRILAVDDATTSQLTTGGQKLDADGSILPFEDATTPHGSQAVDGHFLAQNAATGSEVELPMDVMDIDGQIPAAATTVEEERPAPPDRVSDDVVRDEESPTSSVAIRSQDQTSPSDKHSIVEDSFQELLVLPVDTTLNGNTGIRRPSFAVIRVLEDKRRREKERSRLTKIVFTGESPTARVQDNHTKSAALGSGPYNAKFSQEVVNFLSHSAKKRAHTESVETKSSKQATRQRSGSIAFPHGLQYPKKDYLTPYFQLEAFEQPLQNLLQSSHKTLLTANHQLVFREQQTKKVYRRIQQLQEKGLWSLRQPARVKEPSRKLCHWDYLLQEANWLSVDFRQERRQKIAQCKVLVNMVMEWHEAEPEERKFLCIVRTDSSPRRNLITRKNSVHEMQRIDNGDYEPAKINGGDDEGMDGRTILTDEMEDVRAKSEPLLDRDDRESNIQAEYAVSENPDLGWGVENEYGSLFGHLTTPPIRLFTLGPEETIFQMPLTNSANEILSELPLQIPPTIPVNPSTLDSQYEESWQMPIIPVSKVCVAKLVVNDEGPPRKKSRYEYEENYDLFADDSDSEDASLLGRKSNSFMDRPGRVSQRPVPMPPESTDVALFNPDFKHILNRMQGHNFKPPGFLPPVAFFENRLASQWLPSEDEKLKDLVQRYPQNWALISTFMTFKGDMQSAPERRSPWECFERYLQIESPSAEFLKSPYYKGIQQRLDISGKACIPTISAPNGNGGSGSSTPTIRRRGNAPLRVERRKNTKFVHLFESMRKLAKRRELSLTKQQNAAGIANRKAEQQSQTKPKLNNFVPAHFSKMKYEREMKIEKQARENAALVVQQRHGHQQRNGTPGVNSPVVTSANPTGLPQGVPGMPIHRASPSVGHVLPNGGVPSAGAPVPGMVSIPHNSVSGVATQVNGAAAANVMALGLRQHSGVPTGMHGAGLTPQQLQYMRIKYAQQQQAVQAAAAAQQGQNGSHSVAMTGMQANYSQHAIIAAQQQAINAAASASGMKQHHANGLNGESNSPNGISPQQRPQMNLQGQGQAGSPRLQQPQQMPHHAAVVTHQQISTWVRTHHPNLSAEQVQKVTEQRLAEYHNQIRQQLNNVQLQGVAGFPGVNGVNGVNGAISVQQQQLYQQQQALRQQQHLLAQQQSRQGSQGPAQMQQSTIVGGVVSRGTTPQQTQHLLQRTASMQSVGHPLQRTQSIGQQGPAQVQQQSPRQAQVQQAQMAGIPQPQQSAPQV